MGLPTPVFHHPPSRNIDHETEHDDLDDASELSAGLALVEDIGPKSGSTFDTSLTPL